MIPESERMKVFLALADQLPAAAETINNIYRIVSKYDVPKNVDRDFIFGCLIAYYSNIEEYERCAALLKIKKMKNRTKKITARGLTRKDLIDLRMIGFQVPDEVKIKVLEKERKK